MAKKANKATHESAKKQIDWVEELEALTAQAVAPGRSTRFREDIGGAQADAHRSSWDRTNNGSKTRTR